MRSTCWLFVLLPAFGACGSSTDAAAPTAVVIVSGAGQTGIANGVLADPLVVRVVGPSGAPFAGAPVTFQRSGLVVGNDTSDAGGLAETTWQLTAAEGIQTINILVPGLAPVTAQATSISPCNWDYEYTFAATVNGTLAVGDCIFENAYIDFYGFTFPAGGGSGVFRSSSAFDAYLVIEDQQRQIVAVNDDDPTDPLGGLDSRLRAFLMPATRYRLGPSSWAALTIGSYQASSAAAPADVTGCDWSWIVAGLTLTQTIAAGDCVGSGFYSDQFLLVVPPGRAVTLTLRSTTVDAYLSVLNGATGAVTFDDNSGGGTDARLVINGTVNPTSYLVDAGTAQPGEIGGYSLSITSAPLVVGAAPLGVASPRGQATGIRRQLRSLLAHQAAAQGIRRQRDR